jgi:hypothetical protein
MTETSNKNNSPSRHWFVHNWESESFFPTQAEAIDRATSDLKYCQDPDDGSWADFVDDIYVGYVTNQVKPTPDGYSLRSTFDNDSSEERLCQRKISTILAALRMFQSTRMELIDAVYGEYFQEYSQLSDEEIDDLCEMLNCNASIL